LSVDQHTTQQLAERAPEPGQLGAFSILVVCGGVSSTYPLGVEGQMLIGRAPHAAIRIEHRSVSREHARLSVGEYLELEDLGSANGTHLRGQPLQPGVRVRLGPSDVVDLGEVLLVVQSRRLEQRLNRICSPAFFELRLEEETERAAGGASKAMRARLTTQGELSALAVQALLAAELGPQDLVCSAGSERFELLLLERSPSQAAELLSRLKSRLLARGLAVEAELLTHPSDHAPALEPARPARARPETEDLAAYAPLLAADPAMLRVCRLLERVAQSDLGVILLGETGVGKEMCAQLLHRRSPRQGGKLVCLNCAALPEALLESELFGHERGAFTGATTDKLGLLATAHGGSVFLDEVGDMPLATQVKLLRVLEAKEVLPLGARSPRPLNVRVIAATNRDLQERITMGLFREDLFYRINGISIIVPPLRERLADIAPLAQHFAEKARRKGEPALRLTEASLAFLRAQRWPGNVRELKNAVERAVVLCDGPTLEAYHFSDSSTAGAPAPSQPEGLRAEVGALERERIEQALREAGGSQRRAAALLGISRGALLRRLGQYGLGGARRGS
jgi:DNA-binding NtrC family response regulator